MGVGVGISVGVGVGVGAVKGGGGAGAAAAAVLVAEYPCRTSVAVPCPGIRLSGGFMTDMRRLLSQD